MATKFYTASITAPITISEDDNVGQVSILVSSGTCDVVGSFPFQGNQPSVISLSAGQGMVLSGDIGSPLDGVIITPTGTTDVIMKFS